LFRRAAKTDRNSADAYHYLGIALTGLNRAEQAVRSYEKALAMRPNFAEAHNNLGHALQTLGRAKEAIAHYEKALAIRPDYAEARNNLGNAVHMLERPEEAIAHYRQAIAIRPAYAEAYVNLGNALRGVGRMEQAIAHYERAVALDPKHAEAHHHLGNALVAAGRSEEAVAHFATALAINPSWAEAHTSLGSTLHLLRRYDEAITQYERALAIRPDYAEAHNKLGAIFLALGRPDEASHAYENAIASSARRAGAYWNLAQTKRFAPDDRHLAAMRELARDMASLDVDEQLDLHFALGKAFADLGDHKQSFRHVLRGNSLMRQQISYDEASMLQRFARIRAVFSAGLIRKQQGFGDPSPVPVFIVGMPRSGTTLVEQILASHPKVFGADELPEMGKLAAGISGPDGSSFPEAVRCMSGEQLRELGEAYLRAIRRMAPEAERITDKLPGNFAHAGLIHLTLPNARIIHTRRDPRDTAVSCFSILFSKGQLEFTYDFGELGRYICAYKGLIDHWRSVLPEGVMLEVQYEEVVENLEQQARRIVAHCGLEWNNACLAFYRTERSVRTASAAQVRRPIYHSSVGRWRQHEDQLRPLLQALEGP